MMLNNNKKECVTSSGVALLHSCATGRPLPQRTSRKEFLCKRVAAKVKLIILKACENSNEVSNTLIVYMVFDHYDLPGPELVIDPSRSIGNDQILNR